MANPLLLDLAPEPSGTLGLAVLIVVVMLVLAFVAILLVGFVFLLKRRQRQRDASVGGKVAGQAHISPSPEN